MATAAGQDIQTPVDPTGFASLSGAALLQLLSGLTFADDVGAIITTVDVAGNPTVPDAATTTKYQRYAWRRVGAASVGVYVWNPVAASDATYLRWQSINIAGIAAGSIQNYMIQDNTILDAKIANLDWSKLLNVPSLVELSGAAGGDLTGSTWANPIIAGGVVSTAKLANSAVDVNKLADDAVETAKIKDQNVTTGKIADSGVTAVKAAEAFRNDSQQYATGVFAAGVYSVTLVPAATAYSAGMVVRFKADTINTGATDINVNALGVKNVFKNVTSELVAGDVPANSVVTAVYDGANFQIQSVAGVVNTISFARCGFAGRGTNGAATLIANTNVASVTRSAAGVYDVLFTSAFPSTDYGILLGIEGDAANNYALTWNTKATTGFSLYIGIAVGATITPSDAPNAAFQVFG